MAYRALRYLGFDSSLLDGPRTSRLPNGATSVARDIESRFSAAR